VASYSVLIKASAAKELEDLPQKEIRRISRKVQRLGDEPRPPGCEKLTGGNRYRIRQGDYRVVYSVDDARAEVIVFKVGHRRDVYR
jgi:mRNA interferase RelE/StbE